MSTVVHIPRKRRVRDLAKAETFRPSDLFKLYGISEGTVCRLCQSGALPSILIPGKGGRKGMRLIQRTDMENFLTKHRAPSSCAAA